MKQFIYTIGISAMLSMGLLAQANPDMVEPEQTQPIPESPESGWTLSTNRYKCSLEEFGPLKSITPDVLTFSFFEPGVSKEPTSADSWYYSTRYAFSTNAKNAIRAMIATASVHTDWQEVTETSGGAHGQVRFISVGSSDIGGWGQTSFPVPDNDGMDDTSDIKIKHVYDVPSTTDWRGYNDGIPGTAGWRNLLHELGHALGLKHPFDRTLHPNNPDCYLPDGGAVAAATTPENPTPTVTPFWNPSSFGSPGPPSGADYCYWLTGTGNKDASSMSIMTYRYLNYCNPVRGWNYGIESNFKLYDLAVLNEYYKFNDGK